jgi:hypothetical protein
VEETVDRSGGEGEWLFPTHRRRHVLVGHTRTLGEDAQQSLQRLEVSNLLLTPYRGGTLGVPGPWQAAIDGALAAVSDRLFRRAMPVRANAFAPSVGSIRPARMRVSTHHLVVTLIHMAVALGESHEKEPEHEHEHGTHRQPTIIWWMLTLALAQVKSSGSRPMGWLEACLCTSCSNL